MVRYCVIFVFKSIGLAKMKYKSNIDFNNLTKLNEDSLQLTKIELANSALAGKTELFYVTKAREYLVYELSELTNLFDEHKQEWLPLFDYDKDQSSITNKIQFDIGIPVKLNSRCLMSLVLNGHFEKQDLFDEHHPSVNTVLSESHTNYAHGEVKWILNTEQTQKVSYEDLFVVKDNKPKNLSINSSENSPSNTALKVIGLLMKNLAKIPRFASGTSPNKAQIKELLLDLAVEFDINNYGLSKVDERLLVDAMKYLDNQKN